MQCRAMPARDRRNARLATWLLALWAVVFLGTLFALDRGLIPAGPLSVGAALVPCGLAIVAVLAYMRFLRQADELHRKIQFEAMSLGFAAGFVASFASRLFAEVGWTGLEPGDVFSVMMVFYLLGIFLGTKRYA